MHSASWKLPWWEQISRAWMGPQRHTGRSRQQLPRVPGRAGDARSAWHPAESGGWFPVGALTLSQSANARLHPALNGRPAPR